MKKDYKPGTYLTKKARKNKKGTICPVCASCNNKKFCKNRKDTKLMRQCPDCKECRDAENCDSFYLGTENKVLIPIGRDEETGRIIRKSFSGETKSEATYKSVQYQKDLECGNIEPIIRKTIHSVVSIIQEYEDNKLKNGIISECTYHTNMFTLSRIKDKKWANKPIHEVSRKEIESFLLDERANGMSNSILKKDYAIVRAAFDIALDRKYILNTNHFFLGRYGIIRPKSLKKDKKVRALTIDEQVKLTKYLKENDIKHKDIFMLCLNTGARIGEILALKLEDVDLNNNCFYIRRTTTLDENGKVILGDTTKTYNGERIVILNQITKPVIEHAIQCKNFSQDNLIFCKEDGTLYGDTGMNSAFKRICKNAGIKSDVNTHMLRHTFVTRSKEAGVDASATKTSVGHGDIRITQNIYNEDQREYLEEQNKLYLNYIENLGNKSNV